MKKVTALSKIFVLALFFAAAPLAGCSVQTLSGPDLENVVEDQNARITPTTNTTGVEANEEGAGKGTTGGSFERAVAPNETDED